MYKEHPIYIYSIVYEVSANWLPRCTNFESKTIVEHDMTFLLHIGSLKCLVLLQGWLIFLYILSIIDSNC